MGLLDDAIREHLELKRRRGADTNEITRQEQEAFGPPRRGELELDPALAHADEHAPVAEHATFEPAQPAAAPTTLHAVEDPGVHDEPIAHAHEEPHVQDEPPRPHGDPADSLLERPEAGQTTQAFSAEDVRAATSPPPPMSAPPTATPAPATPPPAPDLGAERPRAVPDEPPLPAADPPVTPAPEPASSTPPAPGPVAPSTPRPAEEETEGAEEQDVLEETPEFLQETPEHDRLWFEQRPPRDFDF